MTDGGSKADKTPGAALCQFVTHTSIAGGTAPVVATALIGATGDLLAPAWFLMLGAALAAGAAFQ